MNLRIGRAFPKLAHLLGFGYRHCLRCETPWCLSQLHSTHYTDLEGCHPLCQKCWSELTPQQRLPFYREQVDTWYSHYPPLNNQPAFIDVWRDVKTAVLSGR
jgi:hypothetical protein